MNIKKAKEDIKNTVRAYLKKNDYGQYSIPSIRQRPMLLMGPPGIGKTQIMQQIAQECNIGLVAYTITHHTRQSAVGLPFIKEKTFDGKSYSVTEYTMSEIIYSIYQYMEESGKKEGILFIDEINCVSETLAPTMLQFLQCKTFGNQAVPEGWIIVAAGNPPEYNRSVHDFDFVTLDRVRKIDIEADLDVFKGYARARHLHPFILSYLELRPQNFYRTENDVDGIQFVTARGWEDLSSLIYTYEELSIKVDEDIIHQFIQHEDIAKDVAAYYDLYQKYRDDYDISRILTGQAGADIYTKLFRASFDEHLSCVELLISGLHNYISDALTADNLTTEAYAFLKTYRIELKKQIQKQYSKQPLAHKEYGKIINLKHFDRLLGLIDYDKVVYGGTFDHHTLQIEPTIMDNVTFSDAVMQEEIFGPVAVVIKFHTEEEALAIANDSVYGLGGAVWTQDINRAIRVARGVHTGRMWVNTYNELPAHAPFGGYKQSGIGRETYLSILFAYTQMKNIFISLNEKRMGMF
mgnify:CR=1 FL=1